MILNYDISQPESPYAGDSPIESPWNFATSRELTGYGKLVWIKSYIDKQRPHRDVTRIFWKLNWGDYPEMSLIQVNYIRKILSSSESHRLIHILLDTYSDIISGILSDIPSGNQSGIKFGILLDVSIYIYLYLYLYVYSLLLHSIWHSIWRMFWQSVWHS